MVRNLCMLINCSDCQEVQFETMDKYDFITGHHKEWIRNIHITKTHIIPINMYLA